jgi:transposase
LDENSSATLDSGHGSNDFHWLDLRSPAPVRATGEGSASTDAARAIAAAKKKNDRIDAGKIADCLRCDFLPECHMASTQIRDRRRTLRYRHLLVRQTVQMKNRISGLLMETGVSHNKRRLHKVGYFRELLSSNEEVNESIRPLLRLGRDTIVRLQKTEYALVSSVQRDPLLAERIKRLRTVPGVGPITALTWALEMGDVSRFPSIREAISYCGLCGDEKSCFPCFRPSASQSSMTSIRMIPIFATGLRQSYSPVMVASH